MLFKKKESPFEPGVIFLPFSPEPVASTAKSEKVIRQTSDGYVNHNW